jgi:hypothetical protein
MLELRRYMASSYETQMQSLINADRVAAGVQPLNWSNKLATVAAQGPSSNAFNAANSAGFQPVFEFERAGVDASSAAYTDPTQAVNDVHTSLLTDGTILFPWLTDIGVSVRKNDANQSVNVVVDVGWQAGDANGDGVVDNRDFVLMAQSFNQPGGLQMGKFGCDFNTDGVINALDFNALASNFGVLS